MSKSIVEQYYRAFNAGDRAGMLALLSEDVVHDINQGKSEKGIDLFARFMDAMDKSYREQLDQIVIMSNDDGSRIAAEFVVHGEYLATDTGFPEARGQRYVLPAGTFFEIRDARIARVTTYYNVRDWLQQVGAPSE